MDLVADFIGVTNSSNENALKWLEVYEWNLESAVEGYFQYGGDLSTIGTTSTGTAIVSTQAVIEHNVQFSDIDSLPAPTSGEAFINEYIQSHRKAMPSKRSFTGNQSSYDDFLPLMSTRPGNKDVEYDSDGMRKPDPVKKQRLLDHSPMAAFMHSSENSNRRVVNTSAFSSSARANNNNTTANSSTRDLATLFAPPQEIMLHESYVGATTLCKAKCKWLLVNIQKEDVFDCHLLNRDIWGDSAIKELVKWSFLFWQQIHVSEEGQQFIRLYNVTEFPYIAIIDPRNAKVKWSHSGPVTYDAVAEKLQDFIGTCEVLEVNQPGIRSSSSSSIPDIINISDDAIDSSGKELKKSTAHNDETTQQDRGKISISDGHNTVGENQNSSCVRAPNTLGGNQNINVTGFCVDKLKDHFLSNSQMSKTLSLSVINKLNDYILTKWGTDETDNNSTVKTIKIRFEIPHHTKVTLLFPINAPLYIVALVLSLHFTDDYMNNDFELFTKMPRKGLCSEYLRNNENNTLTINRVCNDNVTLKSIGITADTVLVVEFLGV